MWHFKKLRLQQTQRKNTCGWKSWRLNKQWTKDLKNKNKSLAAIIIINGILQCYWMVHAQLYLTELIKPIQQTFFFQQWRHVVSGLNVRLHVTLEDGHLPTAGKTQGLGSLTEPTCVFVGMLGGASSLVTTTKRVVTTVDGAATQAGAEKWVIVAPFMRLKQTFGDGFYL